MGIKIDIQNHEKVFINSAGQEVYPPGHPFKGMVKPESERTGRIGLPPKSKAEERLEVEASMDDETKAAVKLLKEKGLI